MASRFGGWKGDFKGFFLGLRLNNNKAYLVMNASKDSLKSAKGFKYDRTNMTWIPEETPATTGTPATPAQRPMNR